MITDQELADWSARIQANSIGKALDALGAQDHECLLELCRLLLGDPSPAVRSAALGYLGREGDPNDAVAQEGALAALRDAEQRADDRMRFAALFALKRIGTAEIFSELFARAQIGVDIALEAAAIQARTPEQRQAVLRLARAHLFAPWTPRTPRASHLREAALYALLLHSTLACEEALLIQAAIRFTDEWVLDALAQAGSLDAARQLEVLLDKYPEDCIEYKIARRTIAVIEAREGADED